MSRALLLSAAVAALALGGCSTALKRHEAITTAEAQSPLVQVRLFATTPPSETRTVRGLDLAPEAQAALTAAMLAEGWSTDEIITEMARQQTPRAYERRSDPLRRKVRFVMTVEMVPEWSRDPANIADRVEDLVITLEPTNGERFISWEQQATVYNTVNLGSQTDTASFTLGAEAGVDVGGSLDSLSISPEYTRSRETAETLTTRVVASNVSVDDGALVFSQGSAPNQNLVGNIVVDATLNLPAALSRTEMAWRTSELIEARGVWADPARVTLRPVQITVAARPQPFCVRMGVSCRVRHVTQPTAARSVSEGDDTVVRMTGATSETVSLSGADLGALWSLRTAGHVAVSLQARRPGSQPVTPGFESAATASLFRDWLIATGAPSTRDFLIVDDEGRPIPVAEYQTLQLVERKLGEGGTTACSA